MRQAKDNRRLGSLYVASPVWSGAVAGSEPASESNWSGLRQLISERRVAIGAILIMALVAFEMFNFDTTRFALANLLGETSFLGLQWATILAIAFCAIDFAGLGYLFAPERAGQQRKEIWYLMGAWLLGATMNALMTWWAVSVTVLGQDVGNELLSRSQLVETAPAFVAALVWLTRILFIGAFSVAGGFLFGAAAHEKEGRRVATARQVPLGMPVRATERPGRAHNGPELTEELPAFLHVASHESEEAPRDAGGDVVVEELDLESEPLRPAAPSFGRATPVMAGAARTRK